LTEDEVWVSRVQLPSWDNCKIRYWTEQGKKRRYFYCSRRGFANLEALRVKREEADAYVKPSLGPDWSVRREPRANDTMHSIYFMGPNDPEVRLREVYIEGTKEWMLAIDVDAPPSLGTPAETATQPPNAGAGTLPAATVRSSRNLLRGPEARGVGIAQQFRRHPRRPVGRGFVGLTRRIAGLEELHCGGMDSDHN
jgi:hypothetical protein